MKLLKNKVHDRGNKKKKDFVTHQKYKKNISWSISICSKDFVDHAETL